MSVVNFFFGSVGGANLVVEGSQITEGGDNGVVMEGMLITVG